MERLCISHPGRRATATGLPRSRCILNYLAETPAEMVMPAQQIERLQIDSVAPTEMSPL